VLTFNFQYFSYLYSIYFVLFEFQDLYDEALEIVDTCTYCAKEISPTMWSMFPRIYQCFKKDAIDYVEEMYPALENFIKFGKDEIMKNKDFQNMYIDIVTTVSELRKFVILIGKRERIGENGRRKKKRP